MGIKAFRFDGKRALVVGGATGMGAAAVKILLELGAAEVVVMDFAEVTPPNVTALQVDLRDRASIDAGIDACGGPVHVLLSCAGVADGMAGLERVNFIGQRHLTDRMVGEGSLAPGSSIAMIASVAGLTWEANLPLLLEYLDTPDYESAVNGIEAHPDKATYIWSKQSVCAYVARQAFPFIKRGIRINAIQPGVTDTPLARTNEGWLDFWGVGYRRAAGIEAATPEEQAYPLVFMCSAAASGINGSSLIVDGGWIHAGLTGAFEERDLAPRLEVMRHERAAM